MSAARSNASRRRAAMTRHRLVQCNPVAVAVSRQAMRGAKLDMHIGLYDLAHGAPCGDHLACLAYTLAMGASVEARDRLGSADGKQMHAALRTVVAMSAAGNRWDAAQAPVLFAADKKAEALMLAQPIQPQALADACEVLSRKVRAGTMGLGDVAGPEIYAVPAVAGEAL